MTPQKCNLPPLVHLPIVESQWIRGAGYHKKKNVSGAVSDSASMLPPVGEMALLHLHGKATSLCKGLCHCRRQRDGDAYRMQMGVDGDGDE